MSGDRRAARGGGRGRPFPARGTGTGLRMLAVAALLAAAPAPGQVVTGRVLTAPGDTAVPGAVVRLRADGARAARTTRAGAGGRFAARIHAAVDVVLEAEAPGFARSVSPAFRLRTGDSVEVRLYLGRGEPPGAPLQVVAASTDRARLHAAFARRAAAGLAGWYMTREEIEDSGAKWISELLWTVPGLATLHTQGFEHAAGAGGPCVPMIFLDGLRIGAGTVDLWITPGELEGMEVHTGASAPLEFPVPRAGCPLVLLWSRS